MNKKKYTQKELKERRRDYNKQYYQKNKYKLLKHMNDYNRDIKAKYVKENEFKIINKSVIISFF